MAISRNIRNLFLSIIACIPQFDSAPQALPSSIDPESQQLQAQPPPLPSHEVQLASTQSPAASPSVIDPQSPPLPPPAVNAASLQSSSTPPPSSIIPGSAERTESHSVTINHPSQVLPPESLMAPTSFTRQRDEQWQSAIISFSLTSAVQISLYKFQQTEPNTLPFSILLLSCANLLTFALVVVAKLISNNRLTTTSRALQEVTIIVAFAELCYAVAIPFTLILKCIVWATFTISIIAIAISKYFHYHT